MPEHPRNLIGPQLRRIRTERGLSQAALAARCQRGGWDVSRDIINKLERRTRWISDIELVMLAQCLDVEISQLLPPAKEAAKLAGDYLAS